MHVINQSIDTRCVN